MSRIDLVKTAVGEHLDDSYDLLAMRLLFPPDHVEVKIEQEIKDLYVYPERLQTGYRLPGSKASGTDEDHLAGARESVSSTP
ncbi:MAG: hypothetical protein FH752_18560 [Marinobacter adhaerens]|uniref:Uncharacterized protein n=2 Tax=Marinobacter TaxID=2742 RepID=A0A844I2N9_9GAMM|nr:hypothetical protein [Marinobacter salsuginis]MTJ00613.1 hypothetical protein [Marinobacter adhaerens]GBO84403.1 hypothetical protein MS5N3_18540 [Marinobacter salsuginis]